VPGGQELDHADDVLLTTSREIAPPTLDLEPLAFGPPFQRVQATFRGWDEARVALHSVSRELLLEHSLVTAIVAIEILFLEIPSVLIVLSRVLLLDLKGNVTIVDALGDDGSHLIPTDGIDGR
jgi:hypothetical protein